MSGPVSGILLGQPQPIDTEPQRKAFSLKYSQRFPHGLIYTGVHGVVMKNCPQ